MTKVAPWSFSKIKALNNAPSSITTKRYSKSCRSCRPMRSYTATSFTRCAEDFIGKDTPLPKKFELCAKP